MIHDPLFLLFLVSAGILGLCLGSFATALIYRIPRDIPWIAAHGKPSRSACPSCGATLGACDLVPFFSWALSKGKCRHCGAGIPAFYPLTELSCLILCVALFLSFGAVPAVLPILLLVPFLVAIIVIDWQHMIIPNELNLAVFILGVLHAGLLFLEGGAEWPLYLMSVIALPGLFGLVSFLVGVWKKKKALGMGDMKFLIGAGFFLPVTVLPSYLFFAGIFGIFTAIFSHFQGKKGRFPFGPALILSLILHLFLTGLGFDYKG